jgi:hypothetical protein
VLEDDNYYKPCFISNAVRRLQQSQLNVFCGNSQIAQLSDDGIEVIQERYTMSPIYGNVVREVDLLERLRVFIHAFPVTNLALVWRLGSGIDFSISDEQYNHIAQEKRRAWVWNDPMIYDPEPNSVWTNFCDRLPAAATALRNRRWRFGEMKMNTQWIKLMKHCCFEPCDHEREAIRLIQLDSFCYSAFTAISASSDVLRLAKNAMVILSTAHGRSGS